MQDVWAVQFDITRRVTEVLQAHPGNVEPGDAARARYEQALAMLDRATPTGRWQDADRWQDAETVRAYIFSIMGRRAEARARLNALERLSRTEHVSPWHFALIHLGLKQHDRALDLLEQAFEERAWQIPLLPVEPIFDALRSNPRFIVLVDKMRR